MDQAPKPAARINITKYVWIFALTQAGLGLALLAIEQGFNLDFGKSVGMGVFMGAIAAAMQYFVKDHSRALTKGESWRFSLWATLATCLWAVLLFIGGAVYAVGPADIGAAITEARQWLAENAGLSAIVGVIATLFSILGLYFGSRFFSSQFAKHLKPAVTN